MTEENTVYIGNAKPTMNYVLAVVTQFNNGSQSVTLKARGKAISRAVDVEEIVKNKYVPNLEIKDIVLATEVMEGKEGADARVSSIEIVMKNPSDGGPIPAAATVEPEPPAQ